MKWTKEYRKLYARAYRIKNKDTINRNARKRREKNVEKYREINRNYYANNKKKYIRHLKSPEEQERLRQRDRKSHARNKKKRNQYSKNWRLKNLEYVAAYSKARQQDPKNRDQYRAYWRKALKKRLRDPNKKMRHYLRCRIGDFLRGENKSDKSSLKLLGCTIEEFWKHLESKFDPWMSRENYGNGGWHVDHIIPCSKFDLKCPLQQQLCFHYTNTQPLEHIQNLKKGTKIL